MSAVLISGVWSVSSVRQEREEAAVIANAEAMQKNLAGVVTVPREALRASRAADEFVQTVLSAAPKVDGDVYVLPKEFVVNLADRGGLGWLAGWATRRALGHLASRTTTSWDDLLIARELAVSVENAYLYEQLQQREQRRSDDADASGAVGESGDESLTAVKAAGAASKKLLTTCSLQLPR